MKESSAAATAFEQAAKEAPDDRAKAVDAASVLLVKRSRNLTFTPAAKKGANAGRPAAAEPLDITDPEKRKEAFAAMFAEQKEQVAPRVKAAKDAKALPPIVQALEAAGGLRTLEIAATGEDAEVKGMVADLSDKALKMMAGAVADMTKAVDLIDQSANDLKPV